MVDAAPFRALRYDPAVAGDPAATAAPAYTDVEPQAYATHRAAAPYTVLELLIARDGDYRQAGESLRRWLRTGVLVADAEPAVHAYEVHELRSGGPAVVRGVLVAATLDDTRIRPHEATQPDRVADRLARLDAVPLDVAPITALVRASGLTELLARPPRRRPVAAVTDADGTDHRMWRMDDTDGAAVIDALAPATAVIADGHHRWAAAVRRARAGRGGGAGARTMLWCVDAEVDAPVAHPQHRLIHRWPPGADDALRSIFVIEPIGGDGGALAHAVAAAPPGAIGLRRPGRSFLCRPRDAGWAEARLGTEGSAEWRALDVVAVEHALLPLLGATAEAAGDPVRAAAVVDDNRAAALIVLRPLVPAAIHAIAEGGEVLPPKSTAFMPKPLAGLVLRPADDAIGPLAQPPAAGGSGCGTPGSL